VKERERERESGEGWKSGQQAGILKVRFGRDRGQRQEVQRDRET
jgi:hypothetical protein